MNSEVDQSSKRSIANPFGWIERHPSEIDPDVPLPDTATKDQLAVNPYSEFGRERHLNDFIDRAYQQFILPIDSANILIIGPGFDRFRKHSFVVPALATQIKHNDADIRSLTVIDHPESAQDSFTFLGNPRSTLSLYQNDLSNPAIGQYLAKGMLEVEPMFNKKKSRDEFSIRLPDNYIKWLEEGKVKLMSQDITKGLGIDNNGLGEDVQKFHFADIENVLYQFSRAAQERVLRQLSEVITPGGFLLLNDCEGYFNPLLKGRSYISMSDKIQRGWLGIEELTEFGFQISDIREEKGGRDREYTAEIFLILQKL